ncbi:protein serine/threonine phosphatase [Aureococcus anophagefferens]|nr:protein serine/threonine phosphatase [Aureococcus anophagefferens]
MGGGVSRPPGARQMVLYSLSRKTHFEKGELSKLHVKFRELAAKEGNPYTITLADFQEALTFVGIDESDGTLLAAVFKQMDLTDSGVETGQVNFSQFCAVCSSMLSGPMEEKLDFSFALYDTNGTGLVEKTGMMHPYDRGFYPAGYTVDAWLDGLEARYGGIDSALVWPTYTNIGIDERSQFDYVLAMPGGAAALANVSAALHARGVRALWPYNPGTRARGATPTAARVGTLGWGYWAQTMGEPSPEAPPVDRWKWLDRRRLTHVCNRWAKDHADDLQFAWFNADGFEAWENVWGVWNGLTPRDAEALRRVATMLRFFGARNLTWASGWVPHAPVGGAGVYASLWPTATEALWTLVGRGAAAATARVDVSGRVPEGGRVYDCYGGAELDVKGGAVEVAVEAGGFGCVWATEADGRDFLATMAAMTTRPLGDYGASWVAA